MFTAIALLGTAVIGLVIHALPLIVGLVVIGAIMSMFKK